MTRQCKDAALRVYRQMAKPCVVIAIGTCPAGQGIFKGSYNMPETVDEVLPVDAYVPGCPPKPEAIIDGIVKVIKKLKGTR
jgi:Ni,Fe-hydrogenase III small subunit